MAQALVSSIRRLTGDLLQILLQTSFAQEQHSSSSSSSSAATATATATLHVDDDLNELHRTLRRVKALLHDAERREIRDQSVELWLSDLRDVAHEAEDVLGEYHYELLRASIEEEHPNCSHAAAASSGIVNKRKLDEMPNAPVALSSLGNPCANARISVMSEIAAQIKQIKIKFQEIYESRQNLSLREEDGELQYSGLRKRQPSTSYVKEIGVIGREEDRENLIHLIISDHSPFSVIPIVGMGGVGKTTLAQCIYNDVRIRQFFDQKVWVCVSDECDFIRLTKEIIESVTQKRCTITQPNTLQEILMEKVTSRKLFLVLDDVWSKDRELWECLQASFQTALLVRILITARETCVAEIMQASVPPYQLGPLPEEKSLILFRNCAFGTQDPTAYPDLVEIGNEIVGKCDGLPLAIKVLGGILRYDRDRDSWSEVLKCYTWELDAGREEILSALRLSYYRMPSHLRPCFLYFSVFPKDHEFQRDQVIRMWMAQGYIYAHGNKRLEDIGINYFEELYGRSLLLSSSKDGEVYYKMHAMIRELAMSLSNRMCSGISYGVWHLYAKSSKVLPDFLALNNPKALRTLFNYSVDTYSASCSIISKMACLRVLEVEVYGTELPDAIGSLKHLRYLKIIGRNLRRLPESLCLLYNLQTLDLQHAPFLLELPNQIGNLINLRFIRLYSEEMNKLPESICLLPHLQKLDLKCCYKLSALPIGMEQLTSLRCLETYHSDTNHLICCIEKLTNLQFLDAKLLIVRDNNQKGLEEVKYLNNLQGTLSISGLENIVDVEHSTQAQLISKNHLRKLKLRWRVDDALRYALDKNEEGTYLKVGPSGSGDAMDSAEVEEAVLGSLQPHSNIKSITIHGYNGLRFPKWVSDPAALSNLTEIVIWNCNLSENNLSCLGELPSLKNLNVMDLSVAFIGEYTRRYYGGIIFPSLETLELRYMDKWECFHVVSGDFPCLKMLRVEKCPKLLELPAIPSLQLLFITECQSVKWLHLLEYTNKMHPSELHILTVDDCPELFPKFELRYFNKLKQLVIKDSPFTEISLPIHSELQYIHITDCRYLHLIHWPENNVPTADIQLAFCPMLKNTGSIICGSMQTKPRIIHCPGLSDQCLWSQVEYFQNLQFEELIISNEYYVPSHSCQERSFEYLCIKPHSAEHFQETGHLISYYFCTVIRDLLNRNLIGMVRLELTNCKRLASVSGFHNLRSLKRLVISYCSELCDLLGECLPATLEDLIVMECQKLCSLPSLQNSRALEEIQIWNCTKLSTVVGLQYLTKLETMMVIQCKNLYVSPVERLCARLEHVVIRDCPLLREWCQVNSIPYIQWFGEMNSEEGGELWCQVRERLDHLKF